MSKPTRRERKLKQAGKSEGYILGYAEGYAKGLYDGNPFNKMIEALSNFADTVSKAVKEHPEILEQLKEQNKKISAESLEAPEFDEEEATE